MNIVEWVVWGLACVFVLWGFVTFLTEVFKPEPFPQGPEACYPLTLRRILSGLYTLGMATGVIVTALSDISKFHLVWFVPLFHFFGTQWIGWIYLWFCNRPTRRYYQGTGTLMGEFLAQQKFREVSSLPEEAKKPEKKDTERKESETKETPEKVVLDHPFWDDYAEVLKSAAVKEMDSDSLEKFRQLNCSLLPSQLLKVHWPGWELGIPRPPKLIPKETLSLWNVDIALFLRDFFKRVEVCKLYCDFSIVVERFGEELVEKRFRTKTGLHYNLEAVYWTFNRKFNKWTNQNIKRYDCSLVCALDETLARADSQLRTAFFPTPGPLDIGLRKRKKFQKQMLSVFAPDLEKPLIKQIWGAKL